MTQTPDCIFCKIVNGDTPTPFIYEDDVLVAFDDRYPKAPLHKLIIPRRHIATLNDMTPQDVTLAGQMLLTAQRLAKELNVADHGYRIIMNCNRGGGQEVYHVHLHLLAGRDMRWPPG